MSVRYMQDQGLRAAREGRSIHKYLADQTVTGAYVVEVGAGTYYNIPAGKQVVITHFHVGCEDVDEFAGAYMVSCAAVAGGGAATKISFEVHDHIGTKKEGRSHIRAEFTIPLVVKYSSGARSVSMALIATDTNTVCAFGWAGWVEDESTLS